MWLLVHRIVSIRTSTSAVTFPPPHIKGAAQGHHQKLPVVAHSGLPVASICHPHGWHDTKHTLTNV